MDTSDFPFHKLQSKQFEDVAASILQEKFQIPLLTFSDGRDGGRDASARNTSLRINSKHLKNKNIVVQVKHTKIPGALLDNSTRCRLFKNEIHKVISLAEADELDVYFIVMNYKVPAGQEQKIVKMFRCCGCKHVYVIGTEILARWIRESSKLSKMLWRLYGIGGPTVFEMFSETSRTVHGLEKQMKLVLTRAETPESCLLERDKKIVVKQLEYLRRTAQKQAVVTDLAMTIKSDTKSIRDSMEGLQKPVRSMSRSVSCTQETLQCLAHTVTKNQKTLESMRRSLQKATSDTQPYARKRSPSAVDVHGPTDICSSKQIKKETTEDFHITSELLMDLSSNIGLLKDWRFVGRTLKLDESVIQTVQQEYRGPKEQAYQMLEHWRSSANGDQSKMAEELERALRVWNLNRAADLVKKAVKESKSCSVNKLSDAIAVPD